MFFDRLLIRINLGDDHLALLVRAALARVNDDFLYGIEIADFGLDLFGVHILSVAEDNEIFETPRNEDPSLTVDAPVIARMKIAVAVDGPGRSFRILIVAEHDIRSLDADFPFAVRIGIVNPDILVEDRNSYAPVLLQEVPVTGHKRCAFRNAVAVQNRDANRVKRVNDCLAKRGASAYDHLQLAAEGGQNAFKQSAPQINSDMTKCLAHLHHAL